MSEMSPMRPVSVGSDVHPPTPLWQKVALGSVGLALVAINIFAPSLPLAVGVPIAVVALVTGAISTVQAMRRRLRENATRRVPWVGEPPVSPRELDLFAGIGAGLMVLGGGSIGRIVPSPTGWVIGGAAMVAAFGTAVVLQHRHNRRLRQR